MAKEVVIQFQDFSFKYTAQAEPTLHNINLDIYKGEKILIAGPSGSGKSTIAHAINGLIPFSYKGDITGSLKIKGKETRDLSIFEISKMVGTVLQDSDGQFVGMTVGEDIAFALENDMVPQEEMIAKVDKVSKMVDMNSHLTHSPEELSGGQKQRVALAGILVDDVDILLFDEPLANLDPDTGKSAIELIDDIKEQTDSTVIIIEHRLEDVLWKSVDRIILVDEGRIIFNDTPSKLLISNILVDKGIREPLYITAMKYAGISLNEDMKLDNIKTLTLSDDDKKKIRDWYYNNSIDDKDNLDNKESLLKVTNLDFTYDNGFKALQDINLDIKPGEMLAIVGTNGAGKSTFSKVICGMLKQTAGDIYLHGKNIDNLSIRDRADEIGYVMQNPNQMICQSFIRDEVGFALRQKGASEEEIEKKVNETLKICGLHSFRKWPISALSFGQKKRVTIASILATDVEVIILDEPTAGQDFRHYTEIMEFLKTLNDLGITIIMITHDMHLMLEYAKRAVVFSDGRIIADDTSANILTNIDIIKRANLKETSLYDLAQLCKIEHENDFVQYFIDYERKRR